MISVVILCIIRIFSVDISVLHLVLNKNLPISAMRCIRIVINLSTF